MTTFVAGVIGLGLNYGAYMTEIFRAGIQSVGHGQAEAADALGMTYGQRMRRVVLPQAIRVIIPPTGNEFIAMMKDTALVGFLGAAVASAEVFLRAQLAFSGNVTQPPGVAPRRRRAVLDADVACSRSSRAGWSGASRRATCAPKWDGGGHAPPDSVAAGRWRAPGGGAQQIAIDVPDEERAP